MAERVGIIDLGSNSARLIVMQIHQSGSYHLIYHQKESIRLSEGMSSNNVLLPAAMSRAISTLQIFSRRCELLNVNKMIAVATAAVRNADNRQDFLQMVHEQTQITLQVISGEEESRLGCIGVMNTLDTPDALIFDLGGASTEVALMRNRRIEHALSLPFGAITLTELFGTQDNVSEERLTKLYNYIMRQLEQVPWLDKLNLPIIGIGGTIRNIAKMDQKYRNYPVSKVHNYKIGSLSFSGLWRSLIEKNAEQRRKIPGLSNERADIIVAGSTIIKCLLAVTRGNQIIVSGCGVREGLFFQDYLNRMDLNETVSDVLLHSARTILMYSTGQHIPHAEHVASLALSMFDKWHQLHGFGERERKLLHVASLLHDIGISISYYDHPRHSSYLIENARLFGLTHREQMLCAVIAGWHKGYSAKFARNRLYNEFLDEADWATARKLAICLALAESLDTTQGQVIPHIEMVEKGKKLYLQTFPTGEASLELKAASKHCKWFKKEFALDLVII